MEIKAHFPHRLNTSFTQEIEQLRREKLYMKLRRIESKLELSIHEQIDKLDSQILDYYKPLDFNPANANGYIVKTNKEATNLILNLKKHETDVKHFTVLEFYCLLDLIQKQNDEQIKQQKQARQRNR